jgi:hypothetical protein
MSETIEVLAEAWASLDGKLEEFHTGRAGKDTEGHYLGYLSACTITYPRRSTPRATRKRGGSGRLQNKCEMKSIL